MGSREPRSGSLYERHRTRVHANLQRRVQVPGFELAVASHATCILRKPPHTRQGLKVRYAFNPEHSGQFKVRAMCRCLRIRLSGFCTWLKKPMSKRSSVDAAGYKQELAGHQVCIGLPHVRATGASVPDHRTARRILNRRSRTLAPEILYRIRNRSGASMVRSRDAPTSSASSQMTPPSSDRRSRPAHAERRTGGPEIRLQGAGSDQPDEQ